MVQAEWAALHSSGQAAARSGAVCGPSPDLHVLNAPLVGELLNRLLVGYPGKALLLEAVGPANTTKNTMGCWAGVSLKQLNLIETF